MDEVGKAPGGAWAWIKRHSSLLLAGGVGLAAVWYLFLRGGTSGQAPSAIDLSGAGTGGGGQAGGGGQSGGGTPAAPSTPNTIGLPFPNVDFGVLTGIADQALRQLYEKQYNLEEQINAATLGGNTDLVTTLTNALANVRDQIVNYQPPAPPAPPAPAAPTISTNDLTAWQQAYFAGAQTFAAWLATAPFAVRTGLTTPQLQQIYNYYNAHGEGKLTQQQLVDQMNAWLAKPSTVPAG